MALFVDLPPQLVDYCPLWNVLLCFRTLDALHFRLGCFGRACLAGRPVLGQVAALEELVNLLRPLRAWPIRPDRSMCALWN